MLDLYLWLKLEPGAFWSSTLKAAWLGLSEAAAGLCSVSRSPSFSDGEGGRSVAALGLSLNMVT